MSRVPGTPVAFGLIVAFALLSGLVHSFEAKVVHKYVQPLGSHECTYGPAYWCQNLTNAAGCNAVKHCIQTFWEVETYPEDDDDVCTICKNMVKEARDTLTSNATLDELKQVFYGSCQLLPLKVIKTECKKLADDFIPELVDTLASEMDPNVVCTVSGLCNNAHIDKLLEDKEKVQAYNDYEYHECEKCALVMDKGEKTVERMSNDDLLIVFLRLCGELSSYSDACSTLVVNYHNEIVNSFKNGFTKRNVCTLSGMCSEAFHPHADGYKKSKNALMGVEINNAGERGRITFQKLNEVNDELTCEFCETLVKHLRDILVANTTQEQFLDVLKGLCKQTKTFSNECLSLVEEDYSIIYQFLVNELDGKVLCSLVDICPKTPSSVDLDSIIPMSPLLPVDLIQMHESILKIQVNEDGSLLAQTKENDKKPFLVVDELPPKVQDVKPLEKSPVIDLYYKQTHVIVGDVDLPSDKTVCFLCQSVLNYVQQVVTDPKSEEEIRAALEKSCAVVPSSFEPQCKQFVDQYGDAFISLIAQEVDPSIICPELKLCPVTDVSIAPNHHRTKSNNNCPLCVIFMSAIESEITNNDTEKVIKSKLEKLCGKLPSKWKTECSEFVSNRLQSILDMLVARVKPEEMCVLLEVCPSITLSEDYRETNMIASSGDVTVLFPGYDIGSLLAGNYKTLEELGEVPTPFCLVCTVVMKYLNGEIKDKSNQEEIESVIDSMCSILPNVEESKCQQFVDKNYQAIIKAIQIGTNPTVACMALMVCDEAIPVKSESSFDSILKEDFPELKDLDSSVECIACELFATVFGDRLKNKTVRIGDFDLAAICDEVKVDYKQQKTELYDFVRYGCSLQRTKIHRTRWVVNRTITLLRGLCTPRNCGETYGVSKFHPKCMICKDMIKDIKLKIEDSKMKTDIEYRLESLCDPFPNKDTCVMFVEKYSDKFLDRLINDVNEESVCEEIGYC